MLLTNSISNCINALNAKRNAQQDKLAAQKYAAALNSLSQASGDLRSLCDVVSKIKDAGIVDQPVWDEGTRDKLLDYVNSCGRGVYEGTLTPDTVNLLKEKTQAVRGMVQVTWIQEAGRYAGGTADYLSMIANLTSDHREANALAERITKNASESPTIKSINQLVADVAAAKAITDEFSFNPNIESFLRKVSKKQATVLDLTPEVLIWLKEKRLMDKLKIRFAV